MGELVVLDLLIHEAGGPGPGHSSAEQAGTVADEAGAHRLVLVHYMEQTRPEELERQAGISYRGEVRAARDLDRPAW